MKAAAGSTGQKTHQALAALTSTPKIFFNQYLLLAIQRLGGRSQWLIYRWNDWQRVLRSAASAQIVSFLMPAWLWEKLSRSLRVVNLSTQKIVEYRFHERFITVSWFRLFLAHVALALALTTWPLPFLINPFLIHVLEDNVISDILLTIDHSRFFFFCPFFFSNFSVPL